MHEKQNKLWCHTVKCEKKHSTIFDNCFYQKGLGGGEWRANAEKRNIPQKMLLSNKTTVPQILTWSFTTPRAISWAHSPPFGWLGPIIWIIFVIILYVKRIQKIIRERLICKERIFSDLLKGSLKDFLSTAGYINVNFPLKLKGSPECGMGKTWKKLKTGLPYKWKTQLTCKSKSTFAFSLKVKILSSLNKHKIAATLKLEQTFLPQVRTKYMEGSFPVSLDSYLVYTNWLF